jgi:hypothetical protein
MKLTAEDVSALKALLTVCQIGSIDLFLIEDGVARGLNDSKTFAIISDANVPKFGKSVGIVRTRTLKARLDVFGNKDVSVTALDSGRDEITSLEISAGRNKVQFRCASVRLFDKKVPKAINDAPAFSFSVSQEDSKMLLDAVKVMSAKQIVLFVNCSKKSVSFEVSDPSNEVFTVNLDTEVFKDGEEDSCVVCYASDVFCSVLQNAKGAEIPVVVGAKGTLKTVIMGHEVVLLPQVNNSN